MNWLRLSAIMLLCVLGLALVVACGDDDDDAGDDVGATSPPAETEAPGDGTEAPDGENNTFDVDTVDFGFNPNTFTVTAGEEVTFEVENTGDAPHTMTIYADEEYAEFVPGGDSFRLESGDAASVSLTFDAGMYFFRCEIHPTQMQGTITAE